MYKAYTQMKTIGLYTCLFFIFGAFYYSILDDLFLETKFYLFIIEGYFLGLLVLTVRVNKVLWNNKEIVFCYWYFKKYRYKWGDIDSVYYCPKFGVVHMYISTYDGEFYPIPDVPDKLYKAIEKYAKIKIKVIRHPMEVLPYLRERRKNMRKLRKKKKVK